MSCRTLVLALTVGLGGIASAQPGPPPQPPPPPVDTSVTTTTDSNPVVTTTTTTTTPPPVQTTAPLAQPASESSGPRPDGMALGLGIGYRLPTSLETPNITSFRLRLASGFTLEPTFTVSNVSKSTESVVPPPLMSTDTTDKTTTFLVAMLGRLPLISRGRADFEGLGLIGFRNEKVNPEGPYNNTTTTTFAVGYGIAVGYWFSPHWQLTFNVTNDLVAYSKARQQTAVDMSTESSTTEIGLIFQPQVFFMLHLYN